MCNFPSVRLLALDIDGTLLTDDKRLTSRTGKALANAVQAHIEPVLVTGRPLSGLPAELLSIRGIRYAITSNGAVTVQLKDTTAVRDPDQPEHAAGRIDGTAIRCVLMDPETSLQLLHIAEDAGLLYNVFINGYGYSRPEVYEELIRKYTGTALEDYVRSSRRSAADMEALIRQSSGVENIWIKTSCQEERDELNRQICSRRHLHTVLTARTDIEIGHHDADKGLALQHLSSLLGISKEGIMAIGDNDNDLGMLAAAGISVAMGNAPIFVKLCASAVTGTNEEDGAADIIEQLLQHHGVGNEKN